MGPTGFAAPVTLTVTETVPASPGSRSGNVQVTRFPTAVPPAVAATNAAPAGSVSQSVTLVALLRQPFAYASV